MKMSKALSILLMSLLLLGSMAAVSFAGDTNGLVLHYTFDGNYNDSSANGLNGQAIGDVPFENGVMGQCAKFGGGYLEVADNSLLDLKQAFTVSAWVRIDSQIDEEKIYNDHILVAKTGIEDWDLEAAYSVSIDTCHEAAVEMVSEDWGNENYYASQAMKLITEKWYLLTATFDGNKINFYYDGKFAGSKSVIDAPVKIIDSDGPLMIGYFEEWTFYGYMDDLRIYDRTLSAQEVKALYDGVNSNASMKITLQIDNSKMIVNGQEQEIDPGRETAPIIVNGRTMVPIKAIVQAMGGTISWDGNERRVDIACKSNTIKLWIDKYEAEVNGEMKTMDTAPMISNERTMLPLRFVAENLGCQVEWDEAKRAIIINVL